MPTLLQADRELNTRIIKYLFATIPLIYVMRGKNLSLLCECILITGDGFMGMFNGR